MTVRPSRPAFVVIRAILVAMATALTIPAWGDPPSTGPETEKRFPPLVLPAGFKATLFACDPLLEYPSVIAIGPRAGTVFSAHDYVTGLGIEIVRRDEIRLLKDTDRDGYADKSTVYAKDFNSLQGLAYHDGAVYAMHAPLLTVLRDTDGDGVADERRDLLNGLGLPPEKNQSRLHCANGIVVGHDGWLYLAMGDNGTDVVRPEGDRLLFQAGGILRCRPDGRGLHVFSTGLRNIYDVALDDRGNVFVRDNENDGGDYMIRVCHSFHGADHGYPYLYLEHSDEGLAPLADLGRGSSAGVACYLETAFPAEYRGSLFCCEWGRAVVRYDLKPLGSGFAATKEIDFAATAATDPYGLKPTDLVVDRDGSLLVSDWGDGQRPRRGRGRIYRITHESAAIAKPAALPAPGSPEEWAQQLDSPSRFRRMEAQAALQHTGKDALPVVRKALEESKLGPIGRGHALWLLALMGRRDAMDDLFRLAETDPDSTVRSQAIRAIADLTDPILVEGKLECGKGDTAVASRLARLAPNATPDIVREIVIAHGRLRQSPPIEWWRSVLKSPDAALSHASMQTLRQSGDWPLVLAMLDEPNDSPLAAIARRAVVERPVPEVVDGLLERLARVEDPRLRSQYAAALARVSRKPAPWVYWGYRPGPRPANTVDWERTEAIAKALDERLNDSDRSVRVAVLQQMQREGVPTAIPSLEKWLREERDPARVGSILDALGRHAAADIRSALAAVIRGRDFAAENRVRALTLFDTGLSAANEGALLDLAGQVEDGPVLSALLKVLSLHPKLESRKILTGRLGSSDAEVRAAAVTSLTALQSMESGAAIAGLLHDPDVRVRRAAAAAAGVLQTQDATTTLLALARDDDAITRGSSLRSLLALKESSAVPAAVDALQHPETLLPAMDYLAEHGGPEQTDAVAKIASTNRSVAVLTGAVRALSGWESRLPADSSRRTEIQAAIAQAHGDSGVLLWWKATGPLPASAADNLRNTLSNAETPASGGDSAPPMRSFVALGVDPRIEFGNRMDKSADVAWLARSDVRMSDPSKAQFLASSNGALQVWINGRSVFQRDKAGAFQPDSDRFDVELRKGTNVVVAIVSGTADAALLQMRFRRLGSSAEHERIAQFTLQNTGSADRGRELFHNTEKTVCMKCHRLNAQGGTIGPDLTGVGNRYSRIHLIESILEPSRTIAPSYDTITVALTSGRVVNGVRISETETLLTLGDDQGKTHEILKSDIEERGRQTRSTMPDGLEKRLTEREFLDLVTFLLSQKNTGK